MRALAAMFVLLLGATSLDARAEAPYRTTLDNGLQLIARTVPTTDVVAIELLLDVSALDEPAGKAGIRYLVQRLLLRGSESESGDSMGWRLASVGGAVDTSVGLDYVEIYALVPADGFELAIELVSKAVMRPAFDAVEVDRQKAEAMEVARRARNDPFQETYLALREHLYPGRAYGGSTLGTEGSLTTIVREDIVRFHGDHYVPNRAVLSICGGVGRAHALRAVRRAFARWSRGEPATRVRTSADPLPCSDVVAREGRLGRAHLMMGFPAPAVGENEYYALQVIDSLLSGGARAWLPQKLREEHGLVYHISSFYPTLASDSHLGVYTVCEAEQLEAVKSLLMEVLSNLCEHPVTDADLSRAKSYLIGSYALSHQRMKEQAYALAWYEVLRLSPDFEERYIERIQAVTGADIQAAARSVLRRFVLAVTMPMS